jgi:rare lipoprotein A
MAARARSFTALALLLGTMGCATTRPLADPGAAAPDATTIRGQTGMASFYAGEHDGRRTASGERFDMRALTAAHRTLPFGTRVRVVNLANGREVTVRINDRGPFARGRILDVSYAAARRLGFVGAGVARVKIEVL